MLKQIYHLTGQAFFLFLKVNVSLFKKNTLKYSVLSSLKDHEIMLITEDFSRLNHKELNMLLFFLRKVGNVSSYLLWRQIKDETFF